jgi:hypothetical protein
MLTRSNTAVLLTVTTCPVLGGAHIKVCGEAGELCVLKIGNGVLSAQQPALPIPHRANESE